MTDKLSKADVKFIRKYYNPRDPHFGVFGLAKRFDVHPSTISNVINGKTYRSVGNLEDYIEDKIIMLQQEFYIRLTESELIHLRSLNSEGDVDRCAHDILKNRL